MSGTNTPLVDIRRALGDDILGDDILGDRATTQADGVLADVADALDVEGGGAGGDISVPPSIEQDADGSGAIAAEDPGIAGTDATRFVSLIQPTNETGVLGAALVTFDEAAGTVAVNLEPGGLAPDAEHPMHIHGLTNDAPSLIPNHQLDADADGFLEGNEAMGVIGPVLLGLSTDGVVSDATLASPPSPGPSCATRRRASRASCRPSCHPPEVPA